MSEIETRPSQNVFDSADETKTFKMWSWDQDQSPVLQHYLQF